MRTCRFDVETKITGFGSPEWEKTHEKATKTAAVLETLKQSGATCIGKAVMDELGFRHGCYKLSCSLWNTKCMSCWISRQADIGA